MSGNGRAPKPTIPVHEMQTINLSWNCCSEFLRSMRCRKNTRTINLILEILRLDQIGLLSSNDSHKSLFLFFPDQAALLFKAAAGRYSIHLT